MSALQEILITFNGRIISFESRLKTFIPSCHLTSVLSQDLLSCMKSVGMNPSEQELLDMVNEVRINK